LHLCAGFSVINATYGPETISNQLKYAGVELSPGDIRWELEQRARPRSAFGPPPAIVRNSFDFIVRHPSHKKARAGIDAVYDVTDTLPRISVVTPSGYEIEQIRPRAWAVCVGHLRARWMRGNFATPRASTIKRWCLTNPTVIKRLSSVNQEASWYN